NARVLLGEAVDLDADRRVLKTEEFEIPYDVLVVATGSRNFYFGKSDWEQHAPGLKTIEEATQIRQRILFAFEAAERETDPVKRAEWLTFVVVGAGPTGVELAGALGEIAHDTLRHDFRSIRPEEARILLLDGSDHVLPSYPQDLAGKAEKSLLRLGVRPRTHVRVTSIDDRGVDLKGPNGTQRINSRTVIWAAGVRASPFGEILEKRAGAKLEKSGRVYVQPDCSLPGHPEIFVIGDLAYLEQDGHPLPGVAQVAMQQGSFVAKVIAKGDQPRGNARFHYFDKGQLAVIGRAAAVAEIGKLHLSGLLAWCVWLFVHLMYLVEFSNRILVFIHWGFLYLTFNRGARLITGSDRLLQEVRAEETESVTRV
ncbi:MAG: NAD(P)/FAD-dependent oxidoreductase, partial [Acidobacteriaceae bacterium]|nr:NAD(P)/FAD-dependent oxidoreductase [Acidobacteriaceae bacterium]